MPRFAITPVQTTIDSGVDGKAATVMAAIVQADGGYIDVSSINTDKMIIHVKNTHGVAHAVTIKAGDYSRASLGDLAVTVAATTGEQLIVVESARFKDSDGYILIDFAADFAGLIGAYLLP